VSRRAEGRNEIGLWSSRNEVAIVKGDLALGNLFRQLGNMGNGRQIGKGSLEAIDPLREWQIPKTTFRRVIEWKQFD
jgi:hypothetical protein